MCVCVCVRLVSMDYRSSSEAIRKLHEKKTLALEILGANFKFISPGMELVFGVLQILGHRVKDLISVCKSSASIMGIGDTGERPFVPLLM